MFDGVAVARQLDSPALLVEVRTAFLHGLDQLLIGAAVATALGGLLALALLPARSTRLAQELPGQAESRGELPV